MAQRLVNLCQILDSTTKSSSFALANSLCGCDHYVNKMAFMYGLDPTDQSGVTHSRSKRSKSFSMELPAGLPPAPPSIAALKSVHSNSQDFSPNPGLPPGTPTNGNTYTQFQQDVRRQILEHYKHALPAQVAGRQSAPRLEIPGSAAFSPPQSPTPPQEEPFGLPKISQWLATLINQVAATSVDVAITTPTSRTSNGHSVPTSQHIHQSKIDDFLSTIPPLHPADVACLELIANERNIDQRKAFMVLALFAPSHLN
eukprot:TRINITY_DN66452_c1_g1_i1.p1 TRINITY_DN66452_c1_g1~~TRINITY_DN66452_c1_g1_i1.p1  ORF type:complete len:293 (+),score=3.52 TRINITY_DN66452_c1_g1_i1:113-880(+)